MHFANTAPIFPNYISKSVTNVMFDTVVFLKVYFSALLIYVVEAIYYLISIYL